jgi:DNA-binding protein H-NS
MDKYEGLTTDQLIELQTEVAAALTEKLKAKKNEVDERLRQLRPASNQVKPRRRAYPPVQAKFRNPDRPSETWTGRGKLPRWLDAKLKAGEQIDLFRIASLQPA